MQKCTQHFLSFLVAQAHPPQHAYLLLWSKGQGKSYKGPTIINCGYEVIVTIKLLLLWLYRLMAIETLQD